MTLSLLVFLLFLTLEEAITTLTGVSDITEVPEEDFERLQALHEHPLRINQAHRSALQSTGLFTQYQVETIIDYRSRNGDILSPAELAIVDGFTPPLVDALSLFIDFRQGGRLSGASSRSPKSSRPSGASSRSPGASPYFSGSPPEPIPIYGDLTTGVSYKINEGKGSWQWQAKAAAQAEGTPIGDFSLSLATKSVWGDAAPQPSSAAQTADKTAVRTKALPEALGWSLSYADSQGISQTILGCFNARLGQGLLLWSGTQINSYDKPSSLMKRPTGLVPYRSYSPSYALSGIALNINAGHITIRPFINLGTYFSSLTSFGGNIAWNHRNGQLGLNAVLYGDNQGYSIDFQQTITGVVLYGEAAVTIKGIGWAGYRGSQTSGSGASSNSRTSSTAPAISLTLSALIGATFHLGPVETGLRISYAPASTSSSSSSTSSSSSSSSTTSSKPNTHNLAAAISWLSDSRCHLIEGGALASFETTAQQQTKAIPPFSAKSVKSKITYTATPDSTWKFVTRLATTSTAVTTSISSTTTSSSTTTTQHTLPTKLDLRQDLIWSKSHWQISGRANFAYKNTPAWLGYIEADYNFVIITDTTHGQNFMKFSLNAMAGIFKVDTWDDRIYVYIHDTQGNFGTQAMYGRGYWLSAMASAKFNKLCALQCRILYTDYPWARPQDTHKKASLSARLSLQFSF